MQRMEVVETRLLTNINTSTDSATAVEKEEKAHGEVIIKAGKQNTRPNMLTISLYFSFKIPNKDYKHQQRRLQQNSQ